MVAVFGWVMVTGMDCNPADILSSPKQDIEIRLVNLDDLPVHLFLDGQTFPCCQVPAGGSRIEHRMLALLDGVNVSAGRNGDILTRDACLLTANSNPEGKVSILYSSAGLACMDW
jgi:hypothetical protein